LSSSNQSGFLFIVWQDKPLKDTKSEGKNNKKLWNQASNDNDVLKISSSMVNTQKRSISFPYNLQLIACGI
jgi:hypothetical protein